MSLKHILFDWRWCFYACWYRGLVIDSLRGLVIFLIVDIMIFMSRLSWTLDGEASLCVQWWLYFQPQSSKLPDVFGYLQSISCSIYPLTYRCRISAFYNNGIMLLLLMVSSIVWSSGILLNELFFDIWASKWPFVNCPFICGCLSWRSFIQQ